MSESLTQTARILKLLKTNGSATNRELNRICYRFSPRILELRDEGHVIVSEQIKGGLWRYTYMGHEEDAIKKATCEGCGNEYIPHRYNKNRYCSHECYGKHHPARGRFTPVVPRIMATVTVTDSGCWTSTLSPDKAGYSKVRYKGKMQMTHRVMYEKIVGPIPEGLELDHLCRVRNCVNPKHLEPVTHFENTRRAGGTAKALEALRNKTECKHGHAYTPENTYRYGTGRTRSCRTCTLTRNKLAARRRRRLAREAREAARSKAPASRDAHS